MITGHVINSSSCRNYSTSSVPHPSIIHERMMLNFRDRSLRIISTALERLLDSYFQTVPAKSNIQRRGFVRRICTTGKVEIPEGAQRETGLLFHHEIVSYVETYQIPPSLVVNFDQTPSKYAPVSSRTQAAKGSKHIVIAGFTYKQAITATFGITLANKFLPMQLIYGGKTAQSFPRFKFPDLFSLSASPKHFSNTEESFKLLDEIVIPYVESERKRLDLEQTQFALIILDVFMGQMTQQVIDKLRENYILISRVPANMTHIFQPLDLTVNGSAKSFMKKKFTEWYSSEITKALDNDVQLEDIEIKLRLSILKPLHAEWLVDLYNLFDIKPRTRNHRKWMEISRHKRSLDERCQWAPTA